MKRTIIHPPTLPPPRGFSHGILVQDAGPLLFLAGQDATDANGRLAAPGDLVGQVEQVLRNLKDVTEAAGGRLPDIVKLNIFVRDRAGYLADLKRIGQVFRRYFGDYYPAIALFQVTGFFGEDALVEMEGVAVVGSSRATAP